MSISAIGSYDTTMVAQQGSRTASPKADVSASSGTYAGAASAPTEVLSDRLKALRDREFGNGGSTIGQGTSIGTSDENNGQVGDLPSVENSGAISNDANDIGQANGPSLLMEKILEMVAKEGANALLAQANQLPAGAVSHTTH